MFQSDLSHLKINKCFFLKKRFYPERRYYYVQRKYLNVLHTTDDKHSIKLDHIIVTCYDRFYTFAPLCYQKGELRVVTPAGGGNQTENKPSLGIKTTTQNDRQRQERQIKKRGDLASAPFCFLPLAAKWAHQRRRRPQGDRNVSPILRLCGMSIRRICGTYRVDETGTGKVTCYRTADEVESIEVERGLVLHPLFWSLPEIKRLYLTSPSSLFFH